MSRDNDQTLRHLRVVFSAFARSDPHSESEGSMPGSSDLSPELDFRGWSKLCESCSLADGLSGRSAQLEAIFLDAATNGSIGFETFCDLMRQVAKSKFISADPLTDLITSKLAEFCHASDHAPSPCADFVVQDLNETPATPSASPNSSSTSQSRDGSPKSLPMPLEQTELSGQVPDFQLSGNISSTSQRFDDMPKPPAVDHLALEAQESNSRISKTAGQEEAGVQKLNAGISSPERSRSFPEQVTQPAETSPGQDSQVSQFRLPVTRTASFSSQRITQPDFNHPLLEHHRELTKDCAPLYHAGPPLLSLFDRHCSSVSDGIELQNFQNLCRDIELVPAPLTYTQVRSQFRLISAANEGEGTGGITLTYTGLLVCLRECAELAFGDATDTLHADKQLAKLIRAGATKVKQSNTVEEDDDLPSLGTRDFSNMSLDTDRASSLHREESLSSIYRSQRSLGPSASEHSYRSFGLLDRDKSFKFRTPRMEQTAESPRSRSGTSAPSVPKQSPRSRAGVPFAGADTPRTRAAQIEDESAAWLEAVLAQLTAEHQDGLNELASDFSAREVQLQRERAAAAEELERELEAKLAEVGAREHAARSRHKPKRAELELRAKIEAIDRAEPGVVEDGEREHLMMQLRAVEAHEAERYRMAVKKEFELVENRVRDACDKARARLNAETEALAQALQSEMKTEFEKLRISYETRKKQAQQQHQLRSQGVSRTELPDLAARKKPPRSSLTPRAQQRSIGTASLGEALGRLGSSMRSVSTASVGEGLGNSMRSIGLAETIAAHCAGRACQELSDVLHQIFDSVFEAFVFLDANDDGILDRGELQRQLHRIGTDLSVDQLMLEAGAQGKLPALGIQEFAHAVSWHMLPDFSSDIDREYARARSLRPGAVRRFHDWQVKQRPSPEPQARSPPTAGSSDMSGPWALCVPSVVVQPKASGAKDSTGGLETTYEETALQERARSEPRTAEEGRGRASQRENADSAGERTRSASAKPQDRGRQPVRNPQPYYGGMHGTWVDDEKKRMLDEKKRLEVALIEAQKELKKAERQQRVRDNFLGLGSAGEPKAAPSDRQGVQPGAPQEEWKDTAFGKLRVLKTEKREERSTSENTEVPKAKTKTKKGGQYQWVDPRYGTIRMVDVKTPKSASESKSPKPKTGKKASRKRAGPKLSGSRRSEANGSSPLYVHDLASAPFLHASVSQTRPAHLPHHYQEWGAGIDPPESWAENNGADSFGLMESDGMEDEESRKPTPRRRGKSSSKKATAEHIPAVRAEFVGPMGKYDNKLNPLWSKLDHWDSRIWQRVETRTGLWPRAPPGLHPEAEASSQPRRRVESASSEESPSKRTREWVLREAKPEHRGTVVKDVSPAKERRTHNGNHRPREATPAEPEQLIDSCLEMMADLLDSSPAKSRPRKQHSDLTPSSVTWSEGVPHGQRHGLDAPERHSFAAANHTARGYTARQPGRWGMTEEEAAINARYHVLEPGSARMSPQQRSTGRDSARSRSPAPELRNRSPAPISTRFSPRQTPSPRPGPESGSALQASSGSEREGLYTRETVGGKGEWVELPVGVSRAQRAQWLRESLMRDSQSDSDDDDDDDDDDGRRARWWGTWNARPVESTCARLPAPFELQPRPHRRPRASPSPGSPEDQGLAAAESISPRPRRQVGARAWGVRTRAVDDFVQALKGGLRDSQGSGSGSDSDHHDRGDAAAARTRTVARRL